MGRLIGLPAPGTWSPRTRAAPFLAVPAAIVALSFSLADGGLGIPACLFRAVTGAPCPSCGMTRAFCAISHGRPVDAFRLNVASPLVYAAALGIAMLALAQVVTNRDVLAPAWRRTRGAARFATLVAMSAAWVVGLAGG